MGAIFPSYPLTYLNLHRPTDAARKAHTHDLLERLTSGELETSRLETVALSLERELADARTLTDATADRLRTVEVLQSSLFTLFERNVFDKVKCLLGEGWSPFRLTFDQCLLSILFRGFYVFSLYTPCIYFSTR